MNLIKYLKGYFLFLAIISCTTNRDQIGPAEVPNQYLSPHESALQAFLTVFYRMPFLRQMILTSAAQLSLNNNDSLSFYLSYIYAGVISSMREMESSKRSNVNGDIFFRDLDVRKFFMCPSFYSKSEAEIFYILLASFPPDVRENFVYSSALADGRNPIEIQSGTFINLDLPAEAGDNIIRNYFASGRKLTQYPKILTFHLKRKAQSPSIQINLNGYMIPSYLSIDGRNYILVSKMSLISQNGRLLYISRTKNHLSGNMTTTSHANYSDNSTISAKIDFIPMDVNSFFIFYTVIEAESSPETCLNAEQIPLSSVPTPVEFRKSVFEINEVVNYFKRQTSMNTEILSMIQNNIFSRNIIVGMFLARPYTIDDKFLRSWMFFSSNSIHLKGGLSYSFSPNPSGQHYMPVELVLSVLETDDGILKKVFNSFNDRSRTEFMKELGIVLFQMRIGMRNIHLTNLAHRFAILMEIPLSDLAGDSIRSPLIARVHELLRVIDHKLIDKPLPNIINYDGLNSDNVISVERNKFGTSSVQACSAIKPSQNTVIDGAWTDTCHRDLGSLSTCRIRHIYSSSDSELFVVGISRFNPKTAKSEFKSKVEFNGDRVLLHSFILQHPTSNALFHCRKYPDSEVTRIFTPGATYSKVSFGPTTYSDCLEYNSLLLFFKTKKDTINSDPTDGPILIKDVPSEILEASLKELKNRL